MEKHWEIRLSYNEEGCEPEVEKFDETWQREALCKKLESRAIELFESNLKCFGVLGWTGDPILYEDCEERYIATMNGITTWELELVKVEEPELPF